MIPVVSLPSGRDIVFTGVRTIFLSLFFLSCGPHDHDSTGRPVSGSAIRRGKESAALYCGSCHQLPDPSLLNKASWEKGVLPAMGPRVGIFRFGSSYYPSDVRDPAVGMRFYPSEPLVSEGQWQDIIDYYSGMAPDSMPPQPEHERIDTGLKLFRAVMPKPGAAGSVTCFVQMDATRRKIVSAGLWPNVLRQWSPSLQEVDSSRIDASIVDMELDGDSGIACNIGMIVPNNGKRGSVLRVRFDGNDKLRIDSVSFLQGLARPVQVQAADLNGDGIKDYLICEFGNQRGALSWMEGGSGGFVRHVLRARPGAIKATISDVNHDGLPDIWVLFAQGDEALFLYLNKGHGRFEEQRLLQFPPSYGSSYFELADMNKDGFPDIVYTCGDNADYSVVLKPYHGVYIYLNDGHNRFRQAFFYPVNGCYKAMARDFDGDGDLDLAVIAAFADFGHHPEEGFVYLENRGGMSFKPYSLPATQVGRWLTMDAGDIDGDGKIDLVLGNFSEGPMPSKGKTDFRKGPALMVLMNNF